MFARFRLFIVLITACCAATAYSCPFCTSSGTTLTQDAASAGMILFGTTANARIDPKSPGLGLTDLNIEVVIKKHDVLAGRKTVTLPKYIPSENEKPSKYLVFCDVFKGQIDPYRGQPFPPDSHIADYLKGALAIQEKDPKGKDTRTRLNYFFKYLDDPDIEIANDAYMEFGNVDYKDFRPVAEKLPVEKVSGWLKDPSTPPSRFGLYGSMLGHCGSPADAALLRSMIDDAKKRYQSGMDGLLAGYVMLKPTEGWAYLQDLLKDEKREHLQRYAGLRAVRFLWEFRPDLIAKDSLAEGITMLLNQGDIADLAIEDMRKWSYWKAADRIIGLYGRNSHDVPIIRKAILRYCLMCPGEKAAQFVEDMKKKDPEWVKETHDWLKLETAPMTPATTPAAAKSK